MMVLMERLAHKVAQVTKVTEVLMEGASLKAVLIAPLEKEDPKEIEGLQETLALFVAMVLRVTEEMLACQDWIANDHNLVLVEIGEKKETVVAMASLGSEGKVEPLENKEKRDPQAFQVFKDLKVIEELLAAMDSQEMMDHQARKDPLVHLAQRDPMVQRVPPVQMVLPASLDPMEPLGQLEKMAYQAFRERREIAACLERTACLAGLEIKEIEDWMEFRDHPDPRVREVGMDQRDRRVPPAQLRRVVGEKRANLADPAEMVYKVWKD